MCETAPAEAAVLAGCAHAFCEDCIGQYVRGKVDEGKVMAEQLRCPSVDPKCEAPLLPSDVARCLKAPEAVARYERLALQRCVEADEGMGCCPTAGCEYMFAFDMDNRKCAAPCVRTYGAPLPSSDYGVRARTRTLTLTLSLPLTLTPTLTLTLTLTLTPSPSPSAYP